MWMKRLSAFTIAAVISQGVFCITNTENTIDANALQLSDDTVNFYQHWKDKYIVLRLLQ